MIDSDRTDYVYDENSRLWKVTYPQQSQITNTFDWVGNRLTLPPDTNTLEYNAADQLTRWPGHHRYEYFDTGSLRYQKDDSSTIEKTYAYTYANLLSSVQHNDKSGTPSSTMTWDADGNRVSFTSSTGGTDYFVYDPTAGIPAVVEEYDGSASVYYIREPGGELIARFYMDGEDEVIHYYHFDALGSTRLITDSSGTETDSYTYDAWGRQTAHSGSTAQPYRFVGQLGYYTHHQDTNLFTEGAWQLLQLGVRFYDAELGRFTQVDPAGEGLTWYAYVGNLPTGAADPSGAQVAGPIGGYLGAMYCRLRNCLDCIHRARAEIDPLRDEWLKKNKKDTSKLKGNWHNAFMHCNSACWAVLKCPGKEDCGSVEYVEFALNGVYELTNWPPIKGRRMDIHNNNIGIGCAEKAKTKDDCMRCCWDNRKNWYVIGVQEPR